MIHVVVMKCLTDLPLLIHIEILRVGVGSFVYRLHSPTDMHHKLACYAFLRADRIRDAINSSHSHSLQMSRTAARNRLCLVKLILTSFNYASS
jgi:hypothetical protein